MCNDYHYIECYKFKKLNDTSSTVVFLQTKQFFDYNSKYTQSYLHSKLLYSYYHVTNYSHIVG